MGDHSGSKKELMLNRYVTIANC